MIFLTVVNLR